VDWATHMRRILTRLGEDATYTPSGGGASSTVRGIFQNPYRDALEMGSSAPTFGCMAADVPTISRNATFVIRGVTYKVNMPEADPVSGLVTSTLIK
jgi:hypothetical protein